MARGGARPGAGRKKLSAVAVPAPRPPVPGAGIVLGGPAPAPAAGIETVQSFDPSDPDFVLMLVQTGQNLPDGRPITPSMAAAAKERIAYHRHKLATSQTAERAVRPVRELTDYELAAIIDEEIQARRSRDGTIGTAR